MSRSRFATPGTVVNCWGNGGEGRAVVLANSRHKAGITREQAVDILVADVLKYLPIDLDGSIVRPAVESTPEPDLWRSVTQAEVDAEAHFFHRDDGCAAGQWCADGAGKEWVEVLAVTFGDIQSAGRAARPPSSVPA